MDTKQLDFARNAVRLLRDDPVVIGLAAGGSLLSNELDEFSDIDLVLVTTEMISNDKDRMMAFANRLGKLLTAFTGEHVGEPRVLICLYNDPLLHVDIKFVTLGEFEKRVEDPVILLDKENQLKDTIAAHRSNWPQPGYQWIEDRFWTFVHYGLLKIGRGEYFEALDFLSFLRVTVLGPLLHLKHGNQPRGVRKVETKLPASDLKRLEQTIAQNEKQSLIAALEHVIAIYKDLRKVLYDSTIVQHQEAEEQVLSYLQEIKVQSHHIV